jgi:TPP-dependent pyruvate/acetoin dehydrogenase alpha subunit
MLRLVGLGHASRLYRELDELKHLTEFSRNGDEVAFGTIGNASCAEGLFWEAVNAIGVLQAPVVISIWDDGYGISVENEHQIAKDDLAELLSGFQRRSGDARGFDLYQVKGWDYPALVKTYLQAAETARRDHVPAIIHVVEMTQPQGHSTSGSHERYKSAARLAWEEEFDCIGRFRAWMIANGVTTAEALDQIDKEARKRVETIRAQAWKAFTQPILRERQAVAEMIADLESQTRQGARLTEIRRKLLSRAAPARKDIMVAIQHALLAARDEAAPAKEKLLAWKRAQTAV